MTDTVLEGDCVRCDARLPVAEAGPDAGRVPYHERPPVGDERDDGIGTRPCAGSFRPPRGAPA